MVMCFNENLDDNGEMYEINVMLFIDVMLVLLIIFMVVVLLVMVDVKVNLFVFISMLQLCLEKLVYLLVKVDNIMFIGNDLVMDDMMIVELMVLMEGKKDIMIFFCVDKIVEYEILMKVMDMLYQVGYFKIGLVGEEIVKVK